MKDPANRDAHRDTMMTSHPHPFRVYWPATLFTCALSVAAFLIIPVLILVRVLPALSRGRRQPGYAHRASAPR